MNMDVDRTAAYFRFPIPRVKAAFHYYEAYPHEIDSVIADNDAMTFDKLNRRAHLYLGLVLAPWFLLYAASGFVLKDISIGTSLTIAAIATGVMGLLRLLAPFLSFSKASRKPPVDPPSGGGSVPPAHATPPAGDHHGPNSILSTHL